MPEPSFEKLPAQALAASSFVLSVATLRALAWVALSPGLSMLTLSPIENSVV